LVAFIIQILEAIVPVFIVAGMGFLLRKRYRLDNKTLSTLNIIVFIPALIYTSMAHSKVDWGLFARLAGAVALFFLVMALLLKALAVFRKMDRKMESAFLMTEFINLGNFGLPVVLFAFGREEALPLAVVVMVCGSTLQNSVGLYFTKRSSHNALGALFQVFRYPMIYAAVLGLVAQRFGFALPPIAQRPIDLSAEAAIPVQLIILGMAVAETRLDTSAEAFLASFMRLVVGPVLAFGIALAFGLSGLPLKVFVLQLSGPVAVGMAMFGVQFDMKAGFLSSVVAWSMLFSLVTVSIVLGLLYSF
jgi:malate permease and related proteins